MSAVLPSKALLYASEMFAEVGQHFATVGIEVGESTLNLPAMMAYKDNTVTSSVEGIAYLFRKNKIDTYHGVGRIAAAGKIEVTAEDGRRHVLKTKNIVIATGSESSKLKGIEIDGDRIVTSDFGDRLSGRAGPALDRRRRRHRSGTRLRVEQAWFERHGRRGARSCLGGNGSRDR
jgi:pyruvate/2-oxoglutarate dehydrogenase complex dihydrolipoamide dehydrogenase (E3) component